jgi:hypothetical protein
VYRLGYGLNNQRIWVRLRRGRRDFSVLYSFQTGYKFILRLRVTFTVELEGWKVLEFFMISLVPSSLFSIQRTIREQRLSCAQRSRSCFATDGHSDSLSCCPTPLEAHDHIIVGHLRHCCRAPFLTRRWVCNGPGSCECRHSRVQVPHNSWPYLTVSFETPANLEGQVPVFICSRNRAAQL